MLQYGMNTVIIESADRATKAGDWLNKHTKIKWDIEMYPFLGPNARYHFTFSNPKDATYFALKWR
jgi:hypothetical protein